MPYLDRICTVNVTGEELKKIVSTVQSKGKGFWKKCNKYRNICEWWACSYYWY